MMLKLDVTEIGVFPESDPVDYLRDLSQRQQEPGLLIEQEPLAAAMEPLGAKGILVPDPYEPYQISLPLYLGVTTPRASSEVPHWHSVQTEVYHVDEGELEVLCKHRWEDNGWQRRLLHAGDTLVVQAEVCHFVRWKSAKGACLVFKAPQVPGVGKPPAGKTTCQFCPHFRRGCVLPDGFTPPEHIER